MAFESSMKVAHQGECLWNEETPWLLSPRATHRYCTCPHWSEGPVYLPCPTSSPPITFCVKVSTSTDPHHLPLIPCLRRAQSNHPDERVQIPMIHRDCVAFAIPQVYVRVHHLTFLAHDSHLDWGDHVRLAFKIIKLFPLGLVLKAKQQTVDNRCFVVLYRVERSVYSLSVLQV
jgi:hypothetical protein